MSLQVLFSGSLALVLALVAEFAAAIDSLPSWNDSPAKSAIIDFVTRTTTPFGEDYRPADSRIAVFDNDGTLWCEQPMYVQLAFALDRVKALAPEHPEWRDKEPFKSILADDLKQALAGGEKSIGEVLAVSHAGMSTDEYNEEVRQWLQTSKHPRFKRPYNKCVYQPMLELLTYLRIHRFKTFIVSGGGVEFMRVWAEDAYGIPPDQIVGSVGKLKYEIRDGKPLLLKEPAVELIDDGPGKPVGIQMFIGQRPIFAFGNSDGDFEMLEWTTAGAGLRLGLLLHHTDAEREYAYDRDSPFGKLARGLDEAGKRGWIVVDMKKDWKTVFPAE